MATEVAITCLKFGFDYLKFKEVYALTSKVNLKSERIIQKIGMKKISEFEYLKIKEGSYLKTRVLYKIENE